MQRGMQEQLNGNIHGILSLIIPHQMLLLFPVLLLMPMVLTLTAAR
jgi:hypothetical protein